MPERWCCSSPAMPTAQFPHLNYPFTPAPIHLHYIEKRPKLYIKSYTFSGSIGFRAVKRATKFGDSWCCWCKQSEGGDVELGAEIMEFMEKSQKPTMFPTKRDLVEAGRMDLVEAIQRRGGWYSLGWDDENVGDNKDNVEGAMDSDIAEFQRRVESCKEMATSRENYDNSMFEHEEGDDFPSAAESDSRNSNSLQLASSSSLRELGAGADAGIDGILSRLEKQRNSDFRFNLGKYEHETSLTNRHEMYGRSFDTSKDVARSGVGEDIKFMPGFFQKDVLSTSDGQTNLIIEPKSWRTWSYQRTGFQDTEFEAAEISFREVHVNGDKETYCDGKTVTSEGYAETTDITKEIDPSYIRTRLQHLECELSAALSSLRSKREQSIPEVEIGSSGELQNLSDAWEFQENEFISAKERLRSIRAKLAVLEGKMTLAIIEAQKVVEEKQKRIDGARKALQLLRTTCVVWPNSASEVLLAGSFDGWTTQRKMEKSRGGIFSVYLKLYPGRYEIKFIVDGIWKLDPLRPIVNNNGHDNNLLIVT